LVCQAATANRRRVRQIRRLAVCAAVSLPLLAQPAGERRKISSPIAFYDDADLTNPGMLGVSLYFSRGKVPAGGDTSFPSAYLSLGLHERVTVSASASYVRSTFERTQVNGLGDAYVGAKFLLMPEGKRRPALALKPMIEVLGEPSIADNLLAPDRLNYVLPLVFQKSFDYFRLYSMAGYATRGIIFDSFVFEWNGWSRVIPLVIVSGSRLTREQALISEFGLNRSRADVTGGVAVTVRPGLAVFVNAGRSIGRIDLNSSRYQVTFGASFNVRLWGEK
jgi:hypothetical protein